MTAVDRGFRLGFGDDRELDRGAWKVSFFVRKSVTAMTAVAHG